MTLGYEYSPIVDGKYSFWKAGLWDTNRNKIKSSYFSITFKSMLADDSPYIVTLCNSFSVSITALLFPACQSYKYQESTDQQTSSNKWNRLAASQKAWYKDHNDNFRKLCVYIS